MGAWLFFAYPACRRLPEGTAEELVEAGMLFRALWLVLDHLVDLEEDRNQGVVTGVRLAIDYARKPHLLQALVERLNTRLEGRLENLNRIGYAENLRREWGRLKAVLEGELRARLGFGPSYNV